MNSAFENLGIDVLIYPNVNPYVYARRVIHKQISGFGSEIPPQSGFQG